jgi:hypothetical protein
MEAVYLLQVFQVIERSNIGQKELLIFALPPHFAEIPMIS